MGYDTDVCTFLFLLYKESAAMFRDFSNDTESSVATLDRCEEPNRHFNKMILIGTPEWVRGMIFRLHASGIAEASTWSRLLPTGNPGEVISTLLWHRSSR